MALKKVLLALIAVIIVVIIGFAVFFYYSHMPDKGDQAATIIYSTGSKFQTNLKDSRRIISLNLQIEIIEDKNLLQTLDKRNPELRSGVLNIIRDKTEKEVEGTEGKKALEREILECIRRAFDKDRIINVFIDDIVVQ